MGIVYKILCNETGECYIGSANTKQCYIGRKSEHKTKDGCSSKQIIERDNYTFSIVEENIFIDIELRKREQYWIDTSHHVINTNRAYQSKEQRKEYQKEWREKNKDQNKLTKSLYYEKNKEKISQICKEYYEKNKEEITMRCNEYREKNKEKIRQHKNEQFVCECGGKYTQSHKSRHLKTKKHQNYLIELL